MKEQPREHLNSRVLVWLTQVSAAQASLPALKACLDSKELARVARFRFPEDRARFTLGRVLVRECLASHLHRAPAEIELAYTARGRPYLVSDESIQFSISHSRDMVAVAVTSHSRVGVDLEYIRTGFDPFELAERIFSKSDLKIFQGLPEREKLAAFFRAWTRKEAYLKALGEGITEALEQISVSFGPEESAVICDTRNDASSQSWRLHILPLPADYIGSLACDASDKAAEIQRVRFVKDELVVESAQA